MLNTRLWSMCRTSFKIIGRGGWGFPGDFLGSPIWYVFSVSHNIISRSNFSFTVLIINSFVISSFSSAIPCTRRLFLFEYCSCWSWTFPSFSILVDRISFSYFSSSIIVSLFALSSSFSLNSSDRKFTDSVRSVNSYLPLIWWSSIECVNL